MPTWPIDLQGLHGAKGAGAAIPGCLLGHGGINAKNLGGSVRLLCGVIVLLSACGGGGGGGGLGGIDRAPSGLNMFMGLEPLDDGTALPTWTGVPVYQVRWTDDAGGAVPSSYGYAQIDYGVAASTTEVGAAFVAEIEGDADAFFVDALALIGGNGRIDVYCLPPAPGVYEAELRAQIEGFPGWSELRLRCEAVEDYAMFLSSVAVGYGANNEALLLTDGTRFDMSTMSEIPTPSGQVFDPPSYVSPLADDGKTGVRAMFDASGDPFGYYYWNAEDGSLTPVLSEAEAADVLNWMGAQHAAISADGQTVAMSSYKTGLFVKDRRSGALSQAPGAGDGYDGLEIFGVTASGGEVIFGRALPQFGRQNAASLWAYDPQTGEVSPMLPPNAAVVLSDLDWVNQVRLDAEAKRVLVGSAYYGTFRGYVVDREADTVRPVFEGVEAHAEAREGASSTLNPVLTMTSLSRSGRYAAAAYARYEDLTYWAGSQFVFIEDLETGELFSVGWMPDGAALSGDGWILRDAVVTDDGLAAAFNAAWSGGVSGEAFGFAVVVPRSMWIPVDR